MNIKQFLNSSIYSLPLIILLLSTCRSTDNISSGSNFDNVVSEDAPSTELDKYIYENITKEYNMKITYKWDASLVEQSSFFYPTDPEKVRTIVDLLIKLWIKPYSQLGGNDFLKRIAPREIVLLGSQNRIPGSATRILATASSGRKITLYDVNVIDYTNEAEIRNLIRVIHHEYTHILNQTIPFDFLSFSKISPQYLEQWQNSQRSESYDLGFISLYSRANESEDVAEIVSTMVTNSKTAWDTMLNDFSTDGRVKFDEKLSIITTYFNNDLKIDLIDLQEKVDNAIQIYVSQ